MQLQPTQKWEHVLLSLASEAFHSPVLNEPQGPIGDDILTHAQTYCQELTAEHSRSFYLASSLLPAKKRHAVRALYAFCRITDDIVDDSRGDIRQQIDDWQRVAMAPHPIGQNLPALAWTNARLQYGIPIRYAEQLIEGVTRDLVQTRYETFADLATYCYSVASTVGLMSMHIIGYESHEAIPYAIRLGLALQMTNILRDIGEDWERGRLYLPQDELTFFGLDESDIAAGRIDQRWRRFMRFQIARNRQLYAEAWPGIQKLNQDGRFSIAVAAGVYRAILDDIEAHDYDVFGRRAFVGKWGKLRRLPQLWWQSKWG